MPVKRRNHKRRESVNEYEAAWLRGERKTFIQFKRSDELQQLWDRAGDHDTMRWEPGMRFPEPIV